MNRRQLKTREQAWPRAVASGLARLGFTPNAISLLSVVFAALAAKFFLRAGLSLPPAQPWWPWLVLAAVCIQLRLLCNLLDGLLAIESGLKTKTGELFNEIPDRFGDLLILVGAGLALPGYPFGSLLGWAAAVAAILTAYVRLLGGSLGFAQDFTGPLAKQHRMFALTVGSLAGAVEMAMRESVWSVYVALWIIVIGSAFTFARRTMRIAAQLEAR
jgi:phosphatidylglycerophosphate synthase